MTKNKSESITSSDLKFMSHKLAQAASHMRQQRENARSQKRVVAVKKRIDNLMQGRSDKALTPDVVDAIGEIKDKVSYAAEEQQRWEDESPQRIPVSKTPLPRLQKAHQKLVQTEKFLKKKT